MRLKIRFHSKRGTEIDLNYNYYIASLIYSFLKESDKNYSKNLHQRGYLTGNKSYKMFCFSSLITKYYKISGSKMKLFAPLDLYLTSPNNDFLCHFANGLIKKNKFNIGNTKFKIEFADILKEPVFKNEEKFKSLSPITTHTVIKTNEKRKTVSCSPKDIKFTDNLKTNLVNKTQILYGKVYDINKIDINIDKKFFKNRGKLIKYKNTKIKGYQIPISLKCELDLMKVAYDCGIGEKNSAGFGYLELLS